MEPKLATSLAAVILAAGASSRMGQPKLLLPWNRTTVIGHLIRQWQKLGACQIAVVCREGDGALNDELDWLRFPLENRIVNHRAERGMFSSIQCAANWHGWQPGLTAWAFVLGDQPHVRFSTLETLAAFHRSHPDSICQPSHGGHGHHPVILPRPALSRLAQSGAESLRQFLATEASPSNKCPVNDPGLRLDLDRPEDYRVVQNLLETEEESS